MASRPWIRLTAILWNSALIAWRKSVGKPKFIRRIAIGICFRLAANSDWLEPSTNNTLQGLSNAWRGSLEAKGKSDDKETHRQANYLTRILMNHHCGRYAKFTDQRDFLKKAVAGITYGLGSESQNLPGYVVLGNSQGMKDRVSVHDLHATMLHLLAMDHGAPRCGPSGGGRAGDGTGHAKL